MDLSIALITASAGLIGALIGAATSLAGQLLSAKAAREQERVDLQRARKEEQYRLIAELGAQCIDDLNSFHDAWTAASEDDNLSFANAMDDLANDVSRRRRLIRRLYLRIHDQRAIDAVDNAYTLWGKRALAESDHHVYSQEIESDSPLEAIDDVARTLQAIQREAWQS